MKLVSHAVPPPQQDLEEDEREDEAGVCSSVANKENEDYEHGNDIYDDEIFDAEPEQAVVPLDKVVEAVRDTVKETVRDLLPDLLAEAMGSLSSKLVSATRQLSDIRAHILSTAGAAAAANISGGQEEVRYSNFKLGKIIDAMLARAHFTLINSNDILRVLGCDAAAGSGEDVVVVQNKQKARSKVCKKYSARVQTVFRKMVALFLVQLVDFVNSNNPSPSDRESLNRLKAMLTADDGQPRSLDLNTLSLFLPEAADVILNSAVGGFDNTTYTPHHSVALIKLLDPSQAIDTFYSIVADIDPEEKHIDTSNSEWSPPRAQQMTSTSTSTSTRLGAFLLAAADRAVQILWAFSTQNTNFTPSSIARCPAVRPLTAHNSRVFSDDSGDLFFPDLHIDSWNSNLKSLAAFPTVEGKRSSRLMSFQ